jgi:hypothetical protein
VTEPRETPLVEPEDDGEDRPTPSRRFARLIETPGSRRLALPKLAGAAGAGLLVVGLIWVGGTRIARSVAAWVESQPDYQLAFSEITLDPPPPPYIRTGTARILHQVRTETRRDERFSILSIDLELLRKEFPRSPWVKQVPGAERSYRALVVRLVYRKPVAVAEFEHGLVKVIDEDGVILPDDDIDWVEKGPRFRVRGIARPLIQIWNVKPPASTRPGLSWNRSDVLGDQDEQVLGAARLAEFLLRQPPITPGGKPAPDFVAIRPEEEGLRYFVQDREVNWVFWNEAPGAETIGEPKAEAKWKMLVDHVDGKGPLNAKWPHYLWPTHKGVEFVQGRLPREKGNGKH